MTRAFLPLSAVLTFALACSSVAPPAIPQADPPATPSSTVVATTVAVPPDPPAAVPSKPTLALAVDPSNAGVLASQSSDVVVRVRLLGLETPVKQRPPVNLALVVDTSGSMSGAPIERAREACARLVDALQVGDSLSIVTFGTQSRTVVAAHTLDEKSKLRAKEEIAQIVAEGTTNMIAGLELGLAELSRTHRPTGMSRVVLLGDGVPNDATLIPGIARRVAGLGATITSLGLGLEFDETLMTQVAQLSGGRFHFIDDAARVSAVFEKEVTQVKRVASRMVTVDFSPGPGVKILEVLGAGAGGFATTRVNVADVIEGQTREIFVKLRVDAKASGSVELLDTNITYTDAGGQASFTTNEFESLRIVGKEQDLVETRKPEVQLEFVRLRVAQNLLDAIARARGGDVAGARTLLDQTVKLSTEESKRHGDADLASKAEEARKLKKTIASLAPRPAAFDPAMGTALGGGTGLSLHPTKPSAAPAALSADEALFVKRTHGAAQGALQGDR
jgi:Ca-activated chloride channel family protein